MARYLSRAQAFKKTVKKAEQQLIQGANGPTIHQTEAPLIAFFRQGGATPAEVELALERFQFRGLSERENPARRISVYDTDEEAATHGWTPELKAQVENMLDRGQGADYFKVEVPRLAKPWPKYDEIPADLLANTASVIGIDLDYVLAYERENGNRPEAIEVLESAIEELGEVVVQA